jgi:hypothetical protein
MLHICTVICNMRTCTYMYMLYMYTYVTQAASQHAKTPAGQQIRKAAGRRGGNHLGNGRSEGAGDVLVASRRRHVCVARGAAGLVGAEQRGAAAAAHAPVAKVLRCGQQGGTPIQHPDEVSRVRCPPVAFPPIPIPTDRLLQGSMKARHRSSPEPTSARVRARLGSLKVV